MTKDRGSGIDVLAAWADTPLAQVNDCLRKGEFSPASKQPVAENEKILGEMTPLERAIYTTASAISTANNAMVDEAEEKGAVQDMAAVSRNHTNCEMLEKLLWACIQHRLGIYASGAAIALREDYKIVDIPHDDRTRRRMGMIMIADPFMIFASSMLAGLGAETGKKDK